MRDLVLLLLVFSASEGWAKRCDCKNSKRITVRYNKYNSTIQGIPPMKPSIRNRPPIAIASVSRGFRLIPLLRESDVIVDVPDFGKPKKVGAHPQTSCSKTFGIEFTQVKNDIRCILRDVMVDILVEDGIEVFPSKAVVKKCDGDCGKKKCLSSKQKPKQIPVRLKEKRSKKFICTYHEIMEDVACKCGCPIESRNCHPAQKYNENVCKCYCENEKDKHECRKKGRDYFWDSSTCSCMCQKKPCTTGTIWSTTRCRCVIAPTF